MKFAVLALCGLLTPIAAAAELILEVIENVSSGFYVTPRTQGDRVVLDVAPRIEQLDPSTGAVAADAASSTVSGHLGEWIALSGASIGDAGVESELLARTRHQSDSSYSVWVKVEEQHFKR